MKNRTGTIFLACLCAAGCATTYRYATGQQAELLQRSGAWPWYVWHDFVSPTPATPPTDAGVSYEIATGQTAAEVQAQLGAPQRIDADPQRRGNDAWDYPFATVQFRSGRVTHVQFKESSGVTSYYEKSTRMWWP